MSCWEWMSEKSPHSVLSLILLNPTFFFFVPLPFTTHIPEPGPIWNTKVWPLLHLTHSHHSHLLRLVHSSRSFAGRRKSVNERRFLPRLPERAPNGLITSFAFGGVKDFSYASIPNLLLYKQLAAQAVAFVSVCADRNGKCGDFESSKWNYSPLARTHTLLVALAYSPPLPDPCFPCKTSLCWITMQV